DSCSLAPSSPRGRTPTSNGRPAPSSSPLPRSSPRPSAAAAGRLPIPGVVPLVELVAAAELAAERVPHELHESDALLGGLAARAADVAVDEAPELRRLEVRGAAERGRPDDYRGHLASRRP